MLFRETSGEVSVISLKLNDKRKILHSQHDMSQDSADMF